MVEPIYSVTVFNNIVVVKIAGQWNIQADIGYLTVLDETISKIRHEDWALFVDMRGWLVSQDVIHFKHNRTIQLARSNQQAECWLVDYMEQGAHIQHHIENAGVPFCKCFNKEEAEHWLRAQGFSLP